MLAQLAFFYSAQDHSMWDGAHSQGPASQFSGKMSPPPSVQGGGSAGKSIRFASMTLISGTHRKIVNTIKLSSDPHICIVALAATYTCMNLIHNDNTKFLKRIALTDPLQE